MGRGSTSLRRVSLALALVAAGFGASAPASAARVASSARFGVGEIVVTYTDHSRLVHLPGGRVAPRRLVTVIRYPAADPRDVDVPEAQPATGPFPLVVFAHGFDITPAPYAPLLRAWAGAGYIVAAPIFPLTNPDAPGGADESDLVNQPTDISFVITRMLAADAAPAGVLSGLVDPDDIAVAGQSDGGSTALAVADNRHYLDRRIRAAIILSGARIPGLGGYDFHPPRPALLAVQGTADTVNFPASTYLFFHAARSPKFLLSLPGAPHLGPYTSEQPQLGIVERVTTAFLDWFLKQAPDGRARMHADGNVRRLAKLRGF